MRSRAEALLTPQRTSAGRVAVGVGMLAHPPLLGAPLGVDRVSVERTGWAVRMLGAREVALGAGTLVALRRGDARAARLWLAAGLLADAVDAVAVGAAVGKGTVRPAPGAAVVAVATTAAAVQAAALARD
ncbi:MAG TPA: hypothetical protein VNU66_13020 [Mycobacteriales bacterium]|nr:hypothetical protein [Mycobacteriales bacterium]